MTALEVFAQNNGEVTQAYYAKLAALGPGGEIAVALFRAQKRSVAAKKYRRSRYRPPMTTSAGSGACSRAGAPKNNACALKTQCLAFRVTGVEHGNPVRWRLRTTFANSFLSLRSTKRHGRSTDW